MWKKVLLFWLGIVVTVGVQAEGRTIKAFNDNWQFKRGPFPEDPVKAGCLGKGLERSAVAAYLECPGYAGAT